MALNSVPANATDNIALRQPFLPPIVQSSVVDFVVITFGKNLDLTVVANLLKWRTKDTFRVFLARDEQWEYHVL
jgi:hypothetical protein